ncbi:MAG: nitrous oxide-stimulated promoter family protein [Selenomonadaceae bacterium]|nr:nitrous oxide-stimulated promoter family protein [Selenomonadaceae bacterium]
MGFFSRFLPKRKPAEFKNNIPKEKQNIKKTFGMYCHRHHDTKGDKLCPKCTALLATVMTKMNRCPYGITKPICDRCDRPCFGATQTKEFMEIMSQNQGRMFFTHPIMTIKHKLAGMGVDYAKYQQQKKIDDKAKAKEKAAKERAKGRKGKK